MGTQLVLASGSPRREELLSHLGVNFVVQIPQVDESVRSREVPELYVQRVASAKAAAVDGDVVLGADTSVVLGDQIYGKPINLEHAAAMLWELSGKVHKVMTGVTVQTKDLLLCEVVTTRVEFVSLDQSLIDWYLNLGESSDKAGAYALQGAGSCLVKAIDGSHSNVIGLPLAETATLLTQAGVTLRTSTGSNKL
ncbi:MAG: hypothetical protein CL407_10980 [Acidimicrobiaceae bacterium]|jgi:septum formation protein|nr:hypothetical protein [Acidimicrobiaceae bacterium]|tara:strand:- start:2294 stop:2878 length:585 start_codon:yes stop_codon:yes gene_type:complete